jgi:cytochrome c-type biogenesis protein
MEISTALWGGFSSFFSIWQVCLLQISPFYMAFIAGLFLATAGQEDDPRIGRWVLLPFFAYTAGFTVFYSLLIASGLGISRLLLYNVSDLRLVSGIAILLAGLYILMVDRISFLSRNHTPLLLSALSLFVGISFAFIYSPCITPTMSDIMGIASQSQTAVEGWRLALMYGLGICAAFGVTGVGLVLLSRRSGVVMQNARLIKNICGIIVLIPALLAITGLMRHYKAFVLGFLV